MIKKQQFVRIFSFFSIFIISFSYISHVFSRKWNIESLADNFYAQEEDSVDVLFIGASGFEAGVSPLILWEEAGISGYNRAVGSQQASMMYYYLLESLNYQHPEVIILDAYRLVRHLTLETNESAFRRAFEILPLSVIKLKALFDITSESNLDTFLTFLFPFFRYHTRWQELERVDFININESKNLDQKGQALNFNVFPTELPDGFMAPTGEEARIHKDELLYFEKMIRLCRENDIEVLLLVMPRLSRADYSEYVAVSKFSEENHLLFIDYNLPDLMSEVSFDPSTDMADEGHVNPCGAEKFSRHLAAFLRDNFDLPDRRNDPGYDQWNSDLESLKTLISQNCN